MTERIPPDANRSRTPDFEDGRSQPIAPRSAARRVDENAHQDSQANTSDVTTAISQADGAP